MSFTTRTTVAAVISFVFLFFTHLVQANKSNIESVEADVSKTEAGGWVVEHAIPEVPPESIHNASNGMVYQLVDNQVKWSPEGFESYSRYVYKVTDRAGLEEASKISIEFDPADTEISFNHIRVIRNGESEDRLPESNISLLRQEQELDTDIIDGDMTALVVLDDVRQGDIIDYGFSRHVKYKLWPGEFFDRFALGWSVPVGETRYRLLWPKDKSLNIKSFLTDVEPQIDVQNENKIYTWSVKNSPAIPPEEGTPEWVIAWPLVGLSTMTEWQELKDWAEPYYAVESAMPEDFKQQIKAIRKTWRKPKDRMTEALRLVQDNIRYVGVEIGLGSHVPRSPMEIVQRGYGDCKDKSVLLVTVLEELGIKSWPALVSTDQGPSLPERLPSPYAFNHAIVKVKIKDDVYWLDPTWSHQGGRGDSLVQPAYAFGLPIDGKGGGLEKIVVTAPEQPTLFVEEHFSLPQDGDIGLAVNVTATYRGYHADVERQNIAASSTDEYQRNYLDFYNGSFDGLKVRTPLTIQDNIDENVITINVVFEMERKQAETIELWKQMEINAWAVNGLFLELNQTKRRTDLALPFLINRRHQIQIHTPGYRPSGLDALEEKITGAVYRRWFTIDKDTLQIDFELVNSKRAAPAADAPEAIKFAESIRLNSNLTYYPEQVQKSFSGVFGVNESEFQQYEERFAEALTKRNEEEYVAALRILNDLVQEAAEPNRIRGLFQSLRGEALHMLDRKSSALAAYEEALQLFDDFAPLYFELTRLYRDVGDYENEIKIWMQLVDKLPESVKDVSYDWIRELNNTLSRDGRAELFEPLALSLVRAGFQGGESDDASWLYLRAIDALMSAGNDPDELVKLEISEYVNKIVSPSSLLDMMVSKKYQSIWSIVEDYAGKDLGLAIYRNRKKRQNEFEEDPESYSKLSAYINALNRAMLNKEAVKVAKPYIDDWSSIEAEADDAFWVVNNYAYNLRKLGKYDEAAAAFEKLVALPQADFPSSVSMRINYTHMLKRLGWFEETLAQASAIDKQFASPFGKMFIEEAKVCSLFNLSRESEAKVLLAEMEKSKSDNISAFTGAVSCSRDKDKLERVIIERLESESYRASAMRLFVEGKRSKKAGKFSKEMNKQMQEVLKRESVQAVFSRYGRVVKVDGYY